MYRRSSPQHLVGFTPVSNESFKGSELQFSLLVKNNWRRRRKKKKEYKGWRIWDGVESGTLAFLEFDLVGWWIGFFFLPKWEIIWHPFEYLYFVSSILDTYSFFLLPLDGLNLLSYTFMSLVSYVTVTTNFNYFKCTFLQQEDFSLHVFPCLCERSIMHSYNPTSHMEIWSLLYWKKSFYLFLFQEDLSHSRIEN